MPDVKTFDNAGSHFAWLGALLSILYCVEHDVHATRLALVPMLMIATLLLAALRQVDLRWPERALCFVLGSSCSLITFLIVH
jgi:hypothetical protein